MRTVAYTIRTEKCRDCDNLVETNSIRRGVVICNACKRRIAHDKAIKRTAELASRRAVQAGIIPAVGELSQPETLAPSETDDRWCEHCGHLPECRQKLWSGELLPCQPRGVKMPQNLREPGDLVQLFQGNGRL